MSTVQVGFTPVAAGKGVIAGVAAAAAGAAASAEGEGTGPLGFLGALLDMLTQELGLPASPQAGGEQTADAQTPAPDFAATSEMGAIAANLAIQNSGAPAIKPGDAPKLLRDLVKALTAADQAGQDGKPIDPALEKKLSETADELAGLLGLTLPAPISPAIAPTTVGTSPDSAVVSPAIAPDTEPALPLATAPTQPSPAPSDQNSADADFAAAVKSAIAPLLPPTTAAADSAEATVQSPPASSPSDARPVLPQLSATGRLDKLIEKLETVATQLDTRSPALADKLQALAQSLSGAGAATGATSETLDASLDDADIVALTAPKTETSRPATSPQLFTQPVLPAPHQAVSGEEPQTGGKTADTASAPAPTAETETTGDIRLSVDKPTAEKPLDKDPKVADRKDFGQQVAEARLERSSDAPQSPAQASVAPGRSDSAIVPKTVHAAYQAPVQQVNLPQVAFEVVRQFNQGASRFQIRLDPPEMGRIDVSMKIDSDGTLQARMTVERVETLDLMQRDQRSLEKALAQAGLDGSKTSLEFSLRQNPGRDGQSPQQQQHQQGSNSPFTRATPGVEDMADVVSTQYRGSVSPSGVNLFV